MTITCDVLGMCEAIYREERREKGCGERRILNGERYVCVGEFIGNDGAHIHYMRTVEDERRLAPTVT